MNNIILFINSPLVQKIWSLSWESWHKVENTEWDASPFIYLNQWAISTLYIHIHALIYSLNGSTDHPHTIMFLGSRRDLENLKESLRDFREIMKSKLSFILYIYIVFLYSDCNLQPFVQFLSPNWKLIVLICLLFGKICFWSKNGQNKEQTWECMVKIIRQNLQCNHVSAVLPVQVSPSTQFNRLIAE